MVAEEVEFTISYDGPALSGGAMDVRDLAPALLALGQMFTAAHELLEPNAERVNLEIRATQQGSFIVHLQLAQRWYENVRDLFVGPDATAMAALLSFVGSGLGAISFLRNRRVKKEDTPGGNVRLTLPDGTSMEMPPQVFSLLQDRAFREHAREAVRPLQREGVDTLVIESKAVAAERVVIEKTDLVAFDVPVEDVTADPIENTVEMAVTVSSVSFVDGNKWRLSDGDSTFFAAMADERFLANVDSGAERFGKGDVLRVRMHIAQQSTTNGLRVDRQVLEVLDHISAPRQIRLPLYEADDPDSP